MNFSVHNIHCAEHKLGLCRFDWQVFSIRFAFLFEAKTTDWLHWAFYFPSLTWNQNLMCITNVKQKSPMNSQTGISSGRKEPLRKGYHSAISCLHLWHFSFPSLRRSWLQWGHRRYRFLISALSCSNCSIICSSNTKVLEAGIDWNFSKETFGFIVTPYGRKEGLRGDFIAKLFIHNNVIIALQM